jgi:hypothetical protein
MPFVTDTFTDANTTLLTAHAGELGATGWIKLPGASNVNPPRISSNAVPLAETSGDFQYAAPGIPASRNYTSYAVFNLSGSLNSSVFGVMNNCSSVADTKYRFQWFGNFGSPLFQIRRFVAGVEVVIGTLNLGLSAGSHRLSLETLATGLNAYAQRTSDGFYLTSAGTYTATKTVLLASSDTTITAVGLAAFVISAGTITDVVADSFGADDPAAGTAPAITVQPANQSVTAPATATFSVTATGTALTYQWRKNGTNISGAVSVSYTTPATSVGDSGALFSVVVAGDTAPSATSANATLTVAAGGTAPAITVQPTNQSVTAPATATFSVTATGTALTYQWRKNGTNISGAVSSNYTTPATTLVDNGAGFDVVITGSVAPAATSSVASLSVSLAGTAPSISAQPASQAGIVGGSATFSVTAAGSGALSYQWKFNGINVGTNAPTYTRSGLIIGDNGGTVTVVVTGDTAPPATSTAAVLTVSVPATSAGGKLLVSIDLFGGLSI